MTEGGTAVPGLGRVRRLTGGSRLLAVPLALALVSSTPGTITVRRGECLWVIATRYGTTVAALKRLNHLPDDTIYAGQPLRVTAPPGAAEQAGRPVRHRVAPGDTVGGIALRYGSSVGAVVAANSLDARATIRVGQLLRVPNTAHAGRTGTARTGPGRTGPEPRPAGQPDTPAVRAYPAGVTASAGRHRRQLAGRALPGKAAVAATVRRVAAGLGVDPALALALARQESGFQQRVVSPADAVGVMQVLPSTGRWLSREVVGRPLDLLDTGDNVLAGVSLLAVLTRAAPVQVAVAGYYQGLGSVRRNGMYADTAAYVANVLRLRERYR